MYKEIAEQLSVTLARARQLVLEALRAEARREGQRQPTEEALESIKYRRRRPPV